MSFNALCYPLIALILKYADYTIIHGKIMRGYNFLERMIRRQLQLQYTHVKCGCTSRVLIINAFLDVNVLYHWNQKESYQIYINNKTTNEVRYVCYRKINNEWINIT
jgi:hypothetical protein